jgi:acetyl esterase/lipase
MGRTAYSGVSTGERAVVADFLHGAEPEHAVPARARELAGVPPAWIGVGTLDLPFDENLEYAERLGGHAVPSALEVGPGAFHGFDLFAKQGFPTVL